jgi:hypothetical protein
VIPLGIEVRPELEMRSDMLAFGFSGECVADRTAVGLLRDDLLDYILTAAERAPQGFVVVDMRNVNSLCTTDLGRISALQKTLAQVGWKLILLIGDPIIREVLFTTELDRAILIAANKAELGDLINRHTLTPPTSPDDGFPEFTESELADMEAAGISLDDATKVIEGLRK